MGAYVGFRRFVVVERNWAVVFSDFGTADYNMSGPVCEQMIANNTLGPASSELQVKTPDPARPRLGIGIRAVAEGAYITEIEKGSSAETLGLLQGTVISAVNGIPIKGFDEATIGKILRSSDTMILTIIGRGDIRITKSLVPAVIKGN